MPAPPRLTLLERLSRRRSLSGWRAAVAQAADTPPDRQRRNLEDARTLRRVLNDYLHVAEDRLALPRIGSNAIMRPDDADWWWRPEVFRAALAMPGISGVDSRAKLGGEATLFHDSALREITLRQVRNQSETDLAPYGLQLEVFGFDGSFLSIVLDLPPEAAQGLTRRHLVRFACVVETESPIEILARLNVQHGPNCEQIVNRLSADAGESVAEFDLGDTEFNEKRSEKLWLDLIFDNPQMNSITIRDISFSRCPRAEM